MMYGHGSRLMLLALASALWLPSLATPVAAQESRPLGAEVERPRQDSMQHHARELERLAREMEMHRREMERHAGRMHRALVRAHGDSGAVRAFAHDDSARARFLYRTSVRAPCARLGISFSGADTVVVRDVMPGSGAAEAGLLPGDVILTVDGDAASMRRMAELSDGLEPGDRVRLAIRRAGRELTLDVTAREDICPFRTMLSHLPVRLMCLSGDSAGTTDEACEHTHRSLAHLGEDMQALHRDLAFRIQTEESDSGVWLRFRGHDGPGDSMFVDIDSVRIMTEALALHLDSIGTMMPFLHALPDSMARAFALFRHGEQGQRLEAPHAHEILVRSLALGSRALAGAQLTDLNAQLAEYFQAERGALVIELAPESPAARAGLRAGDVIVAVNGSDVADVADVRRHAAAGDGGVDVTVIRRGERRTISLVP